MPMYFLNISDGENIAVDPEGDEYASLKHARMDALASARELAADALKAGSSLNDIARKVFEIRDETGGMIAAVPFIEALTR